MFSPILSPNELEKLKKAGDSLKSSDKQKEKVMEMIRMNGKEWNTISAGREEVGIPKPKKNQIEDLAEKAQIIKESRNIVYQLQQNKSYAEQKQAEFFQKQAKPIVEGQYEIYNQKTGQYEKVGVMNAIKENLAKNGIIAEKIEALNETINEIVDSIDISDGLENIKELIKEIVKKIELIPTFSGEGPAIERAIVEPLEKPFAEIPDLTRGASASADIKPPPEAEPKAEPEAEPEAESKVSSYEPNPDMVDEIFKNKYERDTSKVLTTTGGKMYENVGSLIKNIDTLASKEAEANSITEADRDYLKLKMAKLYYENPSIRLAIDKSDKNKRKQIRKYMIDLINNIYPNARMAKAIDKDKIFSEMKFTGRGIDVKAWNKMGRELKSTLSGRGGSGRGSGFGKPIRTDKKIPTFQDWMTGNKAIDMMKGNGKPKVLPFQDLLPSNDNIGLKGMGRARGLKIENMSNPDLMRALSLNIASQKAGNSGVGDVINATIDEMFRRKLIKKSEHKKLWYEYCSK